MRLFAFDLGTRCGYAYTQDGVVHVELSGVMDFSSRRHEGGGMRFVRWRKALLDLLGDDEPRMVAYEEVAAHKGSAAAHVYGGLLGTLSEVCETRDIPYRGFSVGTIKRHATGKGNANKQMMIDAACERWGQSVEDDNQADALWLLDLAVKELWHGGE